MPIRNHGNLLLRNRLIYWIPTFLLIAINDGLILAGMNVAGNPLRLLAAALMSYLTLTHDLPDVRQIMRRVLVYLITIVLIMTFYVLGVSFVEIIFRALPTFNPCIHRRGHSVTIWQFCSRLCSALFADWWMRGCILINMIPVVRCRSTAKASATFLRWDGLPVLLLASSWKTCVSNADFFFSWIKTAT